MEHTPLLYGAGAGFLTTNVASPQRRMDAPYMLWTLLDSMLRARRFIWAHHYEKDGVRRRRYYVVDRQSWWSEVTGRT